MFDYGEGYRKMRQALKIPPAPSLEDVATDVEALKVTKHTRALDRLPALKNLRFLGSYDIRDPQFQQICAASQITHWSSNIFGVTSLHSLRNLVNLQVLELTNNTKIKSLDGLEALTGLQSLSLANFTTSFPLDPVSTCKELRYLWLSGIMRTPMRVESLKPLSKLTQLEHIKLSNVRVKDRQLVALHNLINLVNIDLPDFFPHTEFLALAEALPNARGFWLDGHAGRIGLTDDLKKRWPTKGPKSKE